MKESIEPPAELNFSAMAYQEDIHDANAGSAKQIVHAPLLALNHAVTHDQRINVLQNALAAFSHKNTDLHSYEVDIGAIHALTIKLGYCLNHSPEEVSVVCTCLHRILSGCASDRKLKVYQEIGAELCDLLLRSSQVGILRIFCKLEPAKTMLIGCIVSPLLSSLANAEERDDQLFVDVLGAVKDLTFRASDRDKEILYYTPNMLPSLLADIPIRAQEYATAILWNLAMSPKLATEMGQNTTLLTKLKSYLVEQSSSKIRRSAISAIGNIVSHTKNLCALIDDVALWEILKNMSRNDQDTGCRRRAMRTIRCMVGVYPKPDLLDFFTQIALGDTDRDTRIQAIEGLAHLRCDDELTDPMTRALIDIVENTMDTKMTCLACSIFPCGCNKMFTMYSKSQFWSNIEVAYNEEIDSRKDIFELLTIVFNCEDKSKVICQPLLRITVSLLCNPSLVMPDGETSKIFQFLSELTACAQTRQLLVESDEVLAALVSYALEVTTSEEKDKAKGLILKLVPEL